MALSLNTIRERLNVYLQKHMEKEFLRLLTEEDLLEIMNEVAHDLNRYAQLNLERYYKKTGDDTSEDSLNTNYKVQGVIEKVLDFRFLDDGNWDTTFYSYNEDRLILKATPADDVQMDFRYLRQCETITADSDEIDLPESALNEYLNLLRYRFRGDYGDMSLADYEEALGRHSGKAASRQSPNRIIGPGVRRSWLFQEGDDHVHVITDHWISIENFTTDVNGDYYYVG